MKRYCIEQGDGKVVDDKKKPTERGVDGRRVEKLLLPVVRVDDEAE